MSSPRIDVPKLLTPKQVQFFVDEGYLVVPYLLREDEIQEMRADIVALARGKYECKSIQPLPADMSDEQAIWRIGMAASNACNPCSSSNRPAFRDKRGTRTKSTFRPATGR